jgi:hypothetical protein
MPWLEWFYLLLILSFRSYKISYLVHYFYGSSNYHLKGEEREVDHQRDGSINSSSPKVGTGKKAQFMKLIIIIIIIIIIYSQIVILVFTMYRILLLHNQEEPG